VIIKSLLFGDRHSTSSNSSDSKSRENWWLR
jgi:hypothetical protein